MYQTFSFNHIHATLAGTNNEVLMNAARYQVRVKKSRALSASNGSQIMDNVIRFSMIMAHVIDSVGFPFAVPDPFAHPETVGLAWDAYIAEEPTVWDQLLVAIKAPTIIAEDRLRDANAEMDAVSAHNASRFKRKRTTPQRK
jgi:hypothetical protein